MSVLPFYSKIVGHAAEALDFLGNVVAASTEYSIMGYDLRAEILFRIARRLCFRP